MSRRTTPPPAESKFPRGQEDVTVGTTESGNMGITTPHRKKASGTLKPTAKATGNQLVPVISKEAAKKADLSAAHSDVSRPMSGAPAGTTPSS
jgi:hypothetical protein